MIELHARSLGSRGSFLVDADGGVHDRLFARGRNIVLEPGESWEFVTDIPAARRGDYVAYVTYELPVGGD